MRRPVIGVMGGAAVDDHVLRHARRLGSLIAQRGWVLLNGGRDAGVMAASADGACQSGGLVIGVLPGRDTSAAAPGLDVVIVTDMGDARNVINVLSSDVVIACRGGAGTLSEIALAIKSGRPVILLDREDESELWDHIDTGRVRAVDTPEQAVTAAAELLDARST